MRTRQHYPGVYVPGYGNTRRVHILMAEKVLGRRFKHGEQVHHVNEDTLDPSPGNLVICPDAAYHKLLHRRTAALAACGNANWLKCCFCKKHDEPAHIFTKMRVINGKNWAMFYHKACRTAHRTSQRKNARKSIFGVPVAMPVRRAA